MGLLAESLCIYIAASLLLKPGGQAVFATFALDGSSNAADWP